VSKPSWDLQGLCVLLVDDDELDRKSIRRVLATGGIAAEIIEATDAVSAFDILVRRPVDAVFLDFNMPGRDGLWLVRQARSRGLRCPLIVLTGQGDEQTAVELMKAGATDYFSKSTVTPERATSSLRNALRMVEVETALRESEQRARLAVEATQLGTWDLDPKTGKLEVCEQCRTLLCMSPEEEGTYDRFLQSVHPEDREHTDQAVTRALDPASRGAYDIEYRTVSRKGRAGYWLRATGRAFFNEYGRATRFIGTLQDIGQQKQLEAQRTRLFDAERAAREQAEAASRVREDLIAIVSHDLRNPLSTISMSAELLTTVIPAELSARTTKPLETIVRSAGRMKRLISDLLDVATIDAGTMSVRLEVQDATALMREAVEMMLPVAADKSILLDVEFSPAAIQVPADKERILQVFSNLIGNAVKFTREGGSILLSAADVDGGIRFAVADTGQGLSEDHLAHVFDRYWQAKKEGRLGIGLGLSIAKGIIEAHQGKIWAESLLGRGTTFYFTLPKVNDSAE
jgi:PAS domain S-box-containing protein